GEYEVFDVNGRLRAKGEGGSLMLRKGIYFIRIKGKTYKVKL
ncbi:Por secretion system C-terminal sorting domain-containing protein, partial [Candidatus Kryptobacter tengchongensis]